MYLKRILLKYVYYWHKFDIKIFIEDNPIRTNKLTLVQYGLNFFHKNHQNGCMYNE